MESSADRHSNLTLILGSILGVLLLSYGFFQLIEYYLNMPISALAIVGLGTAIISLVFIAIWRGYGIKVPVLNFENDESEKWFTLMWLTYVGLVIWLEPTSSSHFWVIPIMLALLVIKNGEIGDWLGNNLDKAIIPTPQGPMEWAFNEDGEAITKSQTRDEGSSIESTEFRFNENYLQRGELDDNSK